MAEAASTEEATTSTEEATSRGAATLQRDLRECCTLTEVPAELPTLPVLPSHEATVSIAGPILAVTALPFSLDAVVRSPEVPASRVPIFRLQRTLLL
jgi:hypothetical protein